MLVWAPAELAAAFGAPPEEGTVLKLTKAFYGLAHAPRKWYESVVACLLRDGLETINMLQMSVYTV